MPDSLSPGERRALLRTLKTLTSPIFEEIRFILKVPPGILPSNVSLAERAVALLDWAESKIGCGLPVLKETVDKIVADYEWQDVRTLKTLPDRLNEICRQIASAHEQERCSDGEERERCRERIDALEVERQQLEEQLSPETCSRALEFSLPSVEEEDGIRDFVDSGHVVIRDDAQAALSVDNDEQGEVHLVIAVFWKERSSQKMRIHPKLCYREPNAHEIKEKSLMKEDCAVVLNKFPSFLEKLVDFAVLQIPQLFAGCCETWTLTIELFVPVDLLSCPLSAWKDENSELLKIHPLVIGCSDRFDPDQSSLAVDLRNKMKQGWQRFQKRVPDGGTATLDNLLWLDSVRADHENFELYSGFKCFGTWLKSDAKYLARWKKLIRSGIPLALWLCDGGLVRNDVERVFARLTRGTRFHLLREIASIRDEPHQGCVGVFYENPAYVPDVPSVKVEEQFFVWPGT